MINRFAAALVLLRSTRISLANGCDLVFHRSKVIKKIIQILVFQNSAYICPMDQKFVSFYIGAVCEENLAFRIPKENRLNVEAQLMKEGQLNQYLIIDPEEQEKARQQQEALRAKLAEQSKQTEAVKPEPQQVPQRKKPTKTING